MIHPIDDGFLERDPYHTRSSAFAATKGLSTNEKAAAKAINSDRDLATSNSELDTQKRPFGPLIPTNLRSPIPETNGAGFSTALPVRVHSRSSLSHSETTSTNGSPDLRTVTNVSSQRSESGVNQQSQGNIKKKRRSLMTGELSHPAEHRDAESQPESPVTSPARGSEYGNSEKAARILGLTL